MDSTKFDKEFMDVKAMLTIENKITHLPMKREINFADAGSYCFGVFLLK